LNIRSVKIQTLDCRESAEPLEQRSIRRRIRQVQAIDRLRLNQLLRNDNPLNFPTQLPHFLEDCLLRTNLCSNSRLLAVRPIQFDCQHYGEDHNADQKSEPRPKSAKRY
jgi:hypothetical protein